MDSGLVEQGGSGKVWDRVSAGLFVFMTFYLSFNHFLRSVALPVNIARL